MKNSLIISLLAYSNIRILVPIFILGLTLITPSIIYAQVFKCARASTANIKVTVLVRGDATDAQREIICIGESYLEKAVNHPKFKNLLLGLNGETIISFKEKRFRTSRGQVQIKENTAIWNLISMGDERSPSDTDGNKTIDLQIDLVPKRKPTVGATVLGKQPVRTGYWFVDEAAKRKDGVSIARHFMHEWLHIAGFFHYPDNSARGDVPYVLGGVVRDILRDKKERQAATATLKFGSGSEMKLLADENGEDPVLAYLLDEYEDEVDIGEADFKN
jgi:hypothetical protein